MQESTGDTRADGSRLNGTVTGPERTGELRGNQVEHLTAARLNTYTYISPTHPLNTKFRGTIQKRGPGPRKRDMDIGPHIQYTRTQTLHIQ